MKDDYVDAVIKLKVPKWQIGEECSVHFRDTMAVKGVCCLSSNDSSEAASDKSKLYTKCLRCGRTLKNEEAQKLGYGKICWAKRLVDSQSRLF